MECFGVEWSYGGNDENATGLFPSPPKYCDMHEYEQTHYIGDTSMGIEEFELWLQFFHRADYKQEDPLDDAFRKVVAQKGAPLYGTSPAEYFGATRHKHYSNQLQPITKEADIGNTYTASDQLGHRKPWTSFTDADTGEQVVQRMGWWGDEYELLRNNCCYCSDHLIKLLVGTYGDNPDAKLPEWIKSAASFGSNAEQFGALVGESASRAWHSFTGLFVGAPAPQPEPATASSR